MIILRSIVLALATFTRIPMPTLDWQRTNMRYMLAALPFIGVIIGLLLAAWFWISTALGFGNLLFAAGLTVIPILITGGIHLDGYCDTVDALSSRASQERKREILKDPHAGAFAVIGMTVYLLAYVALCTKLSYSLTSIMLLCCIAVISRSAGALASLVFPTAKGGGILDTVRDASGKAASIGCALWMLVALAAAVFLNWLAALAIAAVSFVGLLYLRVMSARQFGGMSGDLAGYLIQLVELFALGALVLVDKVLLVIQI